MIIVVTNLPPIRFLTSTSLTRVIFCLFPRCQGPGYPEMVALGFSVHSMEKVMVPGLCLAAEQQGGEIREQRGEG